MILKSFWYFFAALLLSASIALMPTPAFAALTSVNSSTTAGSFVLPATQDKDLPGFTNTSDKPVTIKIQATGTWAFVNQSRQVSPEFEAFKVPFDGDGFKTKAGTTEANPKLKYPRLPGGALVATVTNAKGELKAEVSGKDQSIELQPGESVKFGFNDETTEYGDNAGSLKINYSVVAPCPVPTPAPLVSCLPDGQLTVFANEEVNLPKLTNTLNKPVTLKVEASGQWNFGTDPNPANIVDANGSARDRDQNGFLFPMRYAGFKPSTLMALKNNQVVASGKSQTIALQPGETVSFIMNDQPGIYFDNTGSQVLKYSFECK